MKKEQGKEEEWKRGKQKTERWDNRYKENRGKRGDRGREEKME